MHEALLASLAPQVDCIYTVTVVQQPVRARMCGFGDKDRRPISPPLVVRLNAIDRKTGREIPCDDLDTTFLIFAADLRTSETRKDANLIYLPHAAAASSRAPSRTASSASSQHSASRSCSPSSPPFEYPSPADLQPSPQNAPRAPLAARAEGAAVAASGLTATASHPLPSGALFSAASPPATLKRPSPTAEPPISLDFPPSTSIASGAKRARSPSSGSAASGTPSAPAGGFIPYAHSRRATGESLARAPSAESACASAAVPVVAEGDEAPSPMPNLIGTLHTNAHKLKGLDGERGVYFVLPDLSVRTEGAFRIRLRLLSIGLGGARRDAATAVVAAAHTDEFKVFSAKKFEGMLDPTPLSQCFAKQGVRIPTRKVAKARAPKGAAAASKVKVEAVEA